MTEIDYQHECNRAELLGLQKPDRSEFFSQQKHPTVEGNDEETRSNEMVRPKTGDEDESVRREGFQRIGGGLEELNTILSSTQKKLNRFKTVCGSFSNLLKFQVGSRKEGNEKTVDLDAGSVGVQEREVEDSPTPQMKREGNMDLDKLDFLIGKAEKAELMVFPLCAPKEIYNENGPDLILPSGDDSEALI